MWIEQDKLTRSANESINDAVAYREMGEGPGSVTNMLLALIR